MRNFRGGSGNRLSNFLPRLPLSTIPLPSFSVVRSQSPDAKAQKDLEGRRLDEEKVISPSSTLALSAIFITPQHIMGFFSTEKHRGVASNESVQRSFSPTLSPPVPCLHPASHPCANFGTDRRFTDSIWPGIQTAVIKSRNKEREYQERQRVSSLRIQEELLLRHAE